MFKKQYETPNVRINTVITDAVLVPASPDGFLPITQETEVPGSSALTKEHILEEEEEEDYSMAKNYNPWK